VYKNFAVVADNKEIRLIEIDGNSINLRSKVSISNEASNIFWAPDGRKFVAGGFHEMSYFNYNNSTK
jgi:hypothetical protein